MFWVMWQNVCEHIPSCRVAQFFLLRFFSVVDLWLLLLVQHDKDKGYLSMLYPRMKKPSIFNSEKLATAR